MWLSGFGSAMYMVMSQSWAQVYDLWPPVGMKQSFHLFADAMHTWERLGGFISSTLHPVVHVAECDHLSTMRL